jgi:hypothetical protein
MPNTSACNGKTASLATQTAHFKRLYGTQTTMLTTSTH